MKIINLYAGPGVGKSVRAAEVFSELKKNNFECELITEYAKDLLYEQRINIIESDQLFILAQQHRRIGRLLDKNVEFLITDSPILLATVYNNPKNLNQDIFDKLVLELYNKYENYDFLLERNLEYRYSSNGRFQTSVDEAAELDKKIKEKLDYFNINYIETENNKNTVDFIINYILRKKLEG